MVTIAEIIDCGLGPEGYTRPRTRIVIMIAYTASKKALKRPEGWS
jgi:hypothetical protein